MNAKHPYKSGCRPSLLRRLACEEDGYAITLSLVSLPFILGAAAFVIDASRIANLHTDLQHATDAMALAGARELDRRNDSITRAQNAIAAMTGNQAVFANGGDNLGMGTTFNVSYSSQGGASQVTVQFLGSIPADDDTLIGAGACNNTPSTNSDCTVKGGTIAEQSNNARYVRVTATPQNVRTIFPLPGTGRDDVPVVAEAVATYTSAACDVTPIYICNPFEGSGKSFNEHFEDGDMYGRQVTMRNVGNSSPGPGNFGFLRTNGQGADVLAHALATGSPGVCYRQDGLDTEPGANVGPVEQGLNTRMGLYGGSFGNTDNDPLYRPDENVRKGQKQSGNGNGGGPSCSTYTAETDELDGMPLPTGLTESTLPGGKISDNGDWNIDLYWDITHGTHATPPSQDPNYDPDNPPAAPGDVTSLRTTMPPNATATINMPSRYDVYRHELQNSLTGNAAPSGETGTPMCHSGYNLDSYDNSNRRVIFSAVLNCDALVASGQLQGAATNLPAEAFARMFMTKPVVTIGSDKEIYLEMIDVSGRGGLGTVENLLREEAELVR